MGSKPAEEVLDRDSIIRLQKFNSLSDKHKLIIRALIDTLWLEEQKDKPNNVLPFKQP